MGRQCWSPVFGDEEVAGPVQNQGEGSTSLVRLVVRAPISSAVPGRNSCPWAGNC